jgi:hypothetical protein
MIDDINSSNPQATKHLEYCVHVSAIVRALS